MKTDAKLHRDKARELYKEHIKAGHSSTSFAGKLIRGIKAYYDFINDNKDLRDWAKDYRENNPNYRWGYASSLLSTLPNQGAFQEILLENTNLLRKELVRGGKSGALRTKRKSGSSAPRPQIAPRVRHKHLAEDIHQGPVPSNIVPELASEALPHGILTMPALKK